LLVDRCELAWAAGFFDGEGWANAVGQAGRRTRQPQARVNQADPEGIPAALLRFQNALGGLGRIGGPHREENRVDLYRWCVSSRGDVERLQEMVAPWLGQVKLDQLATALGRSLVRSREPDLNDEWRAWAAGLYDGEGSLYLLHHRTHQGYQIPEMCLTQTSNAGAPEVLARFIQIVDCGHVNGPYTQEGANAEVYRWKNAARADIERVVAMMHPWLGPVKREQASQVLTVVSSQSPLPRGRPDWGSHKTHCVNGHEYAKTRLRPYVARGAGAPPRDSEQCLECMREQARARREKKKSMDGDHRSLSDHRVLYLLK
jgi:hypothetical protein